MTKNSVTKAEPTIGKNLSLMNDFEGIGSGFENVTTKDLLIPRMTIIQGLSPQVVRTKPEYDANAKVGDVYDIGLQKIFADGIRFIPIYYSKAWLEWAPRSSGKGLVEIHSTDAILASAEKDEKGKSYLDNGNYIAETAQFYGLNASDEFRKVFLPMSGSQLKKAKRLLTLAMGEKVAKGDGSTFTPPLFYRSYVMTTIPESNSEGDWMGWKIERDISLPEFENYRDLLEDIKQFRASLAEGTIRGDVSSMQEETGPIIEGEKM